MDDRPLERFNGFFCKKESLELRITDPISVILPEIKRKPHFVVMVYCHVILQDRNMKLKQVGVTQVSFGVNLLPSRKNMKGFDSEVDAVQKNILVF